MLAMNETILWLLYFASGVVAFVAAYRLNWRITTASVAGAAVTLAGWLLLYRATVEEKRPNWARLDLSLNLAFALIFAAAGAALATLLVSRTDHSRSSERDPGPR